MPGDPIKLSTLFAILVISTGNQIVACVPACAKSATSASTNSNAKSAQPRSTPGSLAKKTSSSKQSPSNKPAPDWSSLLKGVAPQAVKHYHLGQAHLAREAIADYSKLIELAPKEPIGYNCRAKAYKQSGRQDLADKDNKHVRSLMDTEALF